MKLKCSSKIRSHGFFVLICCLSPFRISVPAHLSTAFPVVSSDVPHLPDPGVPSQISPELPSVCQEGLCHNGGTCHPLSLPTGATSFQCDCLLHSLVDSVKKVIVINFFPLSYEMQVLFCFGSEKGRKHWLSYFSAFNPSYCWQLRCKFTEAIWIILICSVI